jgi:hypothetical protein
MLGEAAHYPGNWLYEQWSESDLKARVACSTAYYTGSADRSCPS